MYIYLTKKGNKFYYFIQLTITKAWLCSLNLNLAIQANKTSKKKKKRRQIHI